MNLLSVNIEEQVFTKGYFRLKLLIKKFGGMKVIEDQIYIEEIFCKYALGIFIKAMSYLLRKTKSHINVLKKHIDFRKMHKLGLL